MERALASTAVEGTPIDETLHAAVRVRGTESE